jgi:predicted nucleic acid-binding protein
MRPVVYDAAALIAADRSDRRLWAEHRVRLEMGMVPLVAPTVLAQVSRSPKQAQLRRLLAGCEIAEFDEAAAHRTGSILARSKSADIVDASVVELAVRRGADIVTGDSADIDRLVRASGRPLHVFKI